MIILDILLLEIFSDGNKEKQKSKQIDLTFNTIPGYAIPPFNFENTWNISNEIKINRHKIKVLILFFCKELIISKDAKVNPEAANENTSSNLPNGCFLEPDK